LGSDEFILSSKYYDKEDSHIMYVMADMLSTIRKEVGFNKYNDITSVEALGFFVNDIANNPLSKIKSYKAHYNIKMIKLQLFLNDRVSFVYTQKLSNTFIKPIGGTTRLISKYLFLVCIRLVKVIKLVFSKPHSEDELTNIEE